MMHAGWGGPGRDELDCYVAKPADPINSFEPQKLSHGDARRPRARD
jgi:hypothetical protein